MAKRPTLARKTVSAANLATLGANRLAELLVEATVGDTNLKRKLKLELAAEVGAVDLAQEIDKRIATLATSRTRVSWRKRPELMADLQVHRRAIVDRLAAKDTKLALACLVAWFDLWPGLDTRVKDPKGELSAMFFNAAPGLAAIASSLPADEAVPILADAIETRLSEWAGWIGRAAPTLNVSHAQHLLAALIQGRARPTGRRALVVRKLADRAGDAEAWASTWPDEDQSRPEVGAEIARRLAVTGFPEQAREALERSCPRAAPPSRRNGATLAPEPSPLWEAAEIAVLEAEGQTVQAQSARWDAFARTLDPSLLRDFVSRLPDFDDVEAIDRGLAVAATWGDATQGLAFMMSWPALREAADMICARSGELRGLNDNVPLWASRLEARYPAAALGLIRARARSLAPLGPTRAEEVRALSIEAADLAIQAGTVDGLETHAAFIDSLDALASPLGRRRWV